MKNSCLNFPSSRYVGVYNFLKPTLILRDPELIKEMTIKSFNHFNNHLPFLPEYHDELWRKSLFVLKDQQWRKMRAVVSPAFSQSKLKCMFSMISECADDIVQHILSHQKSVVTLEMKSLFRRKLVDINLNVLFGIKCNSFKDPNNIFYLNCKNLDIIENVSTLLKACVYLICPKIFKIFKVMIFPKEAHRFFRKLVADTIKLRQENEFVAPNIIHVLSQYKKIDAKQQDSKSTSTSAKDKNFDDGSLSNGDITAQAVQLFVAGYETAATLLSFTMYELAVHPEVQQKLAKEFQSIQEGCNGQINYESLNQMKYLNMVMSGK